MPTVEWSEEQKQEDLWNLSPKERIATSRGISKYISGSKEKFQLLVMRWETMGWNFEENEKWEEKLTNNLVVEKGEIGKTEESYNSFLECC